MTWARRRRRLTTTWPASSTPWTWKTCLARSRPIVVISMVDGSSLVCFDSHQLGTTMPRGGHPPHQIQALDRTQPGLPLKPGKAGTMTHDYKRNGTTTLFAALNVLEGTVISRCMQRHRHQEFLRFLNTIERAVPAGKVIHVILDNYATHKHPKVLAWLARHPRWTFHFTPTSGSWLNAVETFFSALTRRRISAAASARSSTSRPRSTATSPSTTTTPNPSPGPNPPTRSSPS